MRFSLAYQAAVLTAAMIPAAAEAQLASTSAAASSYLSQIRTESIGTGYTGKSINNGTMLQSRALAANNGLTTAQTSSSSIPVRAPQIGPSASGSKPFSGLTQGSTLSPYLGLFNTGLNDTVDNYNAFVRPRLDQQRFNRGVQRQQQQLNARVQNLSARPAFESQGSNRIMPTGHRATFGYYSHFYPSAGRRR